LVDAPITPFFEIFEKFIIDFIGVFSLNYEKVIYADVSGYK